MYTGVFSLLAGVQMWVIVFVALMIGFAVPFVIADRTTGLFFNFSYSGTIGDICLMTVVLIGVTILQRGAPLPLWFSSANSQIVWLIVCGTAGILLVMLTTPWPTATWPDRYHNAVVAPLFLFLLPLVLLAIWYNGTPTERGVSLLLVAVWLVFVFYDFAGERINQPARLEKLYGLKVVDGRLQRSR